MTKQNFKLRILTKLYLVSFGTNISVRVSFVSDKARQWLDKVLWKSYFRKQRRRLWLSWLNVDTSQDYWVKSVKGGGNWSSKSDLRSHGRNGLCGLRKELDRLGRGVLGRCRLYLKESCHRSCKTFLQIPIKCVSSACAPFKNVSMYV